MFLSLLLHTLPCDRLRLYNWGMARGMNSTPKDSYGPLIEDLQYPILPLDLMDLNSKLFTNAKNMRGQPLEGGGSSEQQEGTRRKISQIFNVDNEVISSPEDGLHQPLWPEGKKFCVRMRTRREFSTSTAPSSKNWRWERQNKN